MSVLQFPTPAPATTPVETTSGLLQVVIHLNQAIRLAHHIQRPDVVAGLEAIKDHILPEVTPADPAPPTALVEGDYHVIYDMSVADPGRVLGCFADESECDAAYALERRRRRHMNEGASPLGSCRTTTPVRVGTLIQDYDSVMLKEVGGALYYWNQVNRTPEPFRHVTDLSANSKGKRT
jgi:hypothetical protein